MAAYFLGIDYGTGGAKACIIDEKTNLLSYAYREYPIIVSKPGWSEHDPILYWEIAGELIRECLSKAKLSGSDITCVGTSSALPCLVMLDGAGHPINNAYNLMDKRAVGEVIRLKEEIGEEAIFALSGNRLDDHPSIVNLLWEKENRREDFEKICRVHTIDGYIRYKLTGLHTANYSCATFLGGYDIRKNVFDRSFLEKIGINPDWMPRVAACDEIIGTVSEKGAEKTGLSAKTLVCGGQCDFNAGCIGAGITEEGEINMNLGTCGNFGIIHKDDAFMDSMLACAFTVESKNTYITIPTTTTGGGAMRYLRDKFGQLELGVESLTGMSAYTQFDMQADRVPPGSEGLLILPYLMGERTPLWDADARGVIFGLSFHHGKPHIIRAMMESVAYALYSSFRIIEGAGKKMTYPIVLNEGGAQSKIWRRIIIMPLRKIHVIH